MENLSAYILLALRLLMAAALYSFLGWGFYTLWRDLRQQAKQTIEQRAPSLLAVLLEGEEALRFTAPEITIGRHPSCEWLLGDDTVSSQHARLSFHHDQWWLEDLGSRNGTRLNGEPLSAPVVLADQDQIFCGQVGFTIHFENAPREEE
ncbi:MAG: FHA domain-containing protein [Anaerolineales bacterium]|nr:FHA domain-containing protein [Anaerolineales bacterium]MCW5854531.1 FHA domain-containing protein [Anaerolineales bacterium]